MHRSLQLPIKTKIGVLYLVASVRGLQGVHWRKQAVPVASALGQTDPIALTLRKAKRQIGEFLKGDRHEFDVPLDFAGTDFQNKVWRELQRIPYGETRSYREIAKQIGNEGAVRAVGTANGRNPLSLVIPCHRVIAADGSLGGYAGGLELKAKLLALERAPSRRALL